MNLLPHRVIELSDHVTRHHAVEVEWQVFDPLGQLRLQPGRRADFLADRGDALLVGLRAVLELVERGLEFQRQLLGQIRTPGSQGARLQVGDRPDRVALGSHGDLGQVPPRRAPLRELLLLVGKALLVVETVLDPVRELLRFDHADVIEVVVPAVPPGGLGVHDEGPAQAKLRLDDVVDRLFFRHGATRLAEARHEEVQRLGNAEPRDRQQVLLSPNRIADTEHPARSQAGQRLVPRNPVRA